MVGASPGSKLKDAEKQGVNPMPGEEFVEVLSKSEREARSLLDRYIRN